MTARVTNDYNSGWLHGDIRGAWLADTVAEAITASGELVTNGAFATDTSWWTAFSDVTLSVDTQRLKILTDAVLTQGVAAQVVPTVAGRNYAVTIDYTKGTNTNFQIWAGVTQGSNALLSTGNITASGAFTYYFTATAATTWLGLNCVEANTYCFVDNVSVKLAEPDRSIRGKGLVVNGTLTKTAVAAAAALVAYSGFSAANYLEQPYNSDLDFGTGDFCLMGWVNLTNVGTQFIFNRGSLGAGAVGLFIAGSSTWHYNCSATAVNVSAGVTATTGLHFLALARRAGLLKMYVDGSPVYSVANTENVTNAAAKCVAGAGYAYASPVQGSLALWRISATAPSADQIAHIYRTELPLFKPGAQCTIAGTSTAVTALAFDDTTEILHVGTSWGRSGFKDLLRVDSEATTMGAITSLSASQGAVLTGGTSGKYYQPAMLLRDELKRRNRVPKVIGFEYDLASFTSPTTSGSKTLTASSVVGTPYVGMYITGTGIPANTFIDSVVGTTYTMNNAATVTNAGAVAIAQSSVLVPKGYSADTPRASVIANRIPQRKGATKDYVVLDSGFQQTVNFAVSPGSAVFVLVNAVEVV